MKTTKKDIVRLIDGFAKEEHNHLGHGILGIAEGEHLNGSIITEELYEQYQTPLGYIVRDPDFDEVCRSVASKLVKMPRRDFKDCWDILRYVSQYIFKAGITSMTDEELTAFQQGLSDAIASRRATRSGATAGTGVGIVAADALLKQTSPYILSATVARQLSTSLLGAAIVAGPAGAVVPLLGTVGWILSGFGLNSMLGTSWEKVIPAVFWIAAYREKAAELEN